jgi:hypothetical protein
MHEGSRLFRPCDHVSAPCKLVMLIGLVDANVCSGRTHVNCFQLAHC